MPEAKSYLTIPALTDGIRRSDEKREDTVITAQATVSIARREDIDIESLVYGRCSKKSAVFLL